MGSYVLPMGATCNGKVYDLFVTVASIAGIRGLKGAACYSASKHGMIGLTRSLSEDYLGQPITFNAICPGYVDTPIVARNIDSISHRAGISEAEAHT